jgi:hypothetical protein
MMSKLFEMEEMLYLTLMLHCEDCNMDFEFSNEATDPVEVWAKRIAKRAYQEGWRVIDEKVLCNKCESKGRNP